MNIPGRETCLALLKTHRVPHHIIVHSLQVENVARFLVQALTKQGGILDIQLVMAAALLHDITKMDGLRTGQNHAETGGELLRALGYPRVAKVVECHIVVPEVGASAMVTEEEIVNYADKRVLHDRIVTLEERFGDLKERYGKNPDSQARIEASLGRAKEIENRIFRHLSIKPGDLAVKLPRRPVHDGLCPIFPRNLPNEN